MRIVAVLALLGLVLMGAPGPASAQPVAVPDTWGGDFWSRPRLTGMRTVRHPRAASKRSTNAMTSPSHPLVESIRMRSNATSTTSSGVRMGDKGSDDPVVPPWTDTR